MVVPTDSTSVVESGNPTDNKDYAGKPADQTTDPLQLTPTQQTYYNFMTQRLTKAQEMRDRQWPEFSNKTYLKQYEQNEKVAMTYLEPVKNEDEVKVASGTIESKLNTVLSNIESLNLTPEVLAFNKNDIPLHDLGLAITDVMDRCAENDGGTDGGDAEKRSLRQKELLKQGTVFVQDRWVCKYRPEKTLKKDYDGSFDWSEWETKYAKAFEGPERTLLYGPNVYLGDITQFSMDDQPYVFTLEQMSFDVAMGIYSQFDNWKYVKQGMPPPIAGLAGSGVGGRTIFDAKFRLTTLKQDQVEIIKYQDQPRNEFQIMINGVMMLPIGFPLSAVTAGGKYNIAKQILYPINAQFAYGKGFCSSGDIYELSRVLDELIRLFVMKTRKSVTPAYINTSGKVISKRVLYAGNISMGVPVGALQKIDSSEAQGVTAGEYQFYKEILDRIEESTVSPIFQGQFAGSNTTATEVVQVQEQAQKALGLIVASCTMLEVKLGYLRLPIITQYWFAPTGKVAVGTDEKGATQYDNSYRQVSKAVPITGAGQGTRRVIPIDGQLPDKDIIRALEIEDEQATGFPSQRIYLSPQKLKEQRVTWRVVATPKPKESSSLQQMQFGQLIAGVINMVNVGSRPNTAGLEELFAKAFGTDRNKLFANQTTTMMNVPQAQGENGGTPATPASPANLPGAPMASPSTVAAMPS